jgi:hypothetical protein
MENNNNIIKIPNIKNYKNKKDEIKVYIYDQQKYNKKFYEMNKEKIKEIYKCEICDKELSKSNKSNHLKSMKHINNKKNIIIDDNNPDLIII